MIKRVVLVDDEPQMVELMLKSLSAENMKVNGFHDPEEALKYVYDHDIDLVITDVSMPKIQGTDMFFHLKKMNPFLQIIIITAYPSLKNISHMLEAGASDFLIKPFDFDYLKQIVNENFSRVSRWKSLRKEWLKYKRAKVEFGEYHV